MELTRVFNDRAIILDAETTSKEAAFKSLLNALVPIQPSLNIKAALAALQQREDKMSTGVVPHVAIPHALCESVSGTIGAIGIYPRGLDYAALDGKTVTIVFLLLTNPGRPELCLNVLRQLAATLEMPGFLSALHNARTPKEIHAMLTSPKRYALPLDMDIAS
ncbi:PTS sugar transporter subunit IIA [Breznakiellaceae bacterium SP9]